MKRSRLLLLVGIFAVWPSLASAQDGWFGWLEQLSGPGPFHGGGAAVRLFCVLEDGKVTRCFTDQNADRNNPIRGVFELRASWLTSGDNPRFRDTPADTRSVHAFWIDPVFFVRVDRALDVGAGAGLIRFSGDGFNPLYRMTFTPVSVSFVPFAFAQPGDAGLRRWARVVRLRFEETYLTKGFTGADFGSTDTKFSTGGEFRASAGIVFDFASLIR
jgi:hypothetical protein